MSNQALPRWIIRFKGAAIGALFRTPAPSTLRDWRSIAATLLAVLLGLSGSQPAAAAAAEKASKPNIVVITADDLGYGDLRSYGGSISTPNIDALATAGVRFTDFHAGGPVCTPSRAALLTGRYPQRAKLNNALDAASNQGLGANQITVSEVLKGAGYRTGVVGKWHLGHLARFAPDRHGFDFFYGFLKGEIDYVNHLDSLGKLDWWKNTTPISEDGYSTTAITREAVGFIQRNTRQPFFLYVAYQAPHSPYQAPGDQPVRIPGQPKSGGTEGNKANYPLMIQAMDRGIGSIMASLRAANLEQDTFVFFLSDNGAYAPGSNGPLRGGKGSLYEGGHRVPAIAYWPGRIAPGINRETVAAVDLFPTILSLTATESSAASNTDGTNIAPLIFGREAKAPSRRLFWMYQGNTAAREGPWKLVNIKGKTALFNLSSDLGETTNVAAKYPNIAASLTSAINHWKTEVNTN